MNLDMSIQGGGLGGSSGLLDWGSDIARMWGLGMQQGLGMAHSFRDMTYRSALEPSAIAAGYNNNMLAAQQAQNNYSQAFARGQALDTAMQPGTGGVYAPNQYRAYNAPVNTGQQQMQRAVSVAPHNGANTVITNGMNKSGYTNATPGYQSSAVSPAASNALMQGFSNPYGG